MSETKNIFQEFVGKYALSKTLRFELKPVGGTEKLLKENDVFEKDKQVYKNYILAKRYFDDFHRKFIKASLNRVCISEDVLREYEKIYLQKKGMIGQGEKEWEEFQKRRTDAIDSLRRTITDSFEEMGKSWADEYRKIGVLSSKEEDDGSVKKESSLVLLRESGNGDVSGFLFMKEALRILRHEYPDVEGIKIVSHENASGELESISEKMSLFDTFPGATYFIKFQETRKNIYKRDGTATAVATRVVDDNLSKFLENRKIWNEGYSILSLSNEEKGIFDLNFFNKCLTQEGIEEYNRVIGDVNRKVNIFRQQKKKKIPLLKELFKQILFEKKNEKKEKAVIKRRSDVFPFLVEFIKETRRGNAAAGKIVKDFVENQELYDLNGVFLKGSDVTRISNRWFTSWFAFGDLLPKDSSGKKVKAFVSFGEIENALKKTESEEVFKGEYRDFSDSNLYGKFLSIWRSELEKNIAECEACAVKLEKMIEEDRIFSNRKEEKEGKQRETQKDTIREFAESALVVYQMMKYFALEKGRRHISDLGEDALFYGEYEKWLEGVPMWEYFNELRNYLTKKPSESKKIKLNFEKGTLLSGWAAGKNGDLQYNASILRSNGRYFLAVLKNSSLFRFDNRDIFDVSGEEHYDLMEYRQLKANTIYGTLYESRYSSKYKVDKNILHQNELIGRIKTILRDYVDTYPSLRDILDSGYSDAKDLAKDISSLSLYSVSFENKVSKKYLEENISDGFYVFEILNKDFVSGSIHGKNNLHTTYFELLFHRDNLRCPSGAIFKLSGGAEVLLREAIKDLPKKRDLNGKTVLDKKRYSRDVILFHLPVIFNFSVKKRANVSSDVNKALLDQEKLRIIGIDRGEKHLLYVSMIDENGTILESRSLNTISVPNKKEPDDYHHILDKREKERDEARKSWQSIENIRDLKRGYISQAVNEIDRMIFRCLDEGILPMIVFEDLNVGFKRGRFKIEKQVYQNFELAIARKLNYLVSKERGNYLCAPQLTPEVKNFQDMEKRKQVGIIFYVPASFTSAICPQCGFRKRLYGFAFKNIGHARKEIETRQFSVRFDGEKFLFSCTASKDSGKKQKNKNPISCGSASSMLQFSSNVERLTNKRSDDDKKWQTISFQSTEELKKLFERYGISLQGNIADVLLEQRKNFDAFLYRQFICIVNTILKLRNSHTSEGRDFIACPSCGFHSENGFQERDFNGDANGAYNIARKGMLLVKKIKNFGKEKNIENLRDTEHLQIDMEEWDAFVQKEKGVE